MLAQISEKILEYLETAGIETRQIDYNELVDRQVGALQRPAVNISINEATFEKVTLTTRKCRTTVSLFLMIQNLSSEKNRRFDVLDLIETICSALFHADLGLELQDRLKPISFRNVTDNLFAAAGYQLYQLDFSCSFNISEQEEDLGMLRSIVNTYTLDVTSAFSLDVLYGGHAYPKHYVVFNGGRANSRYIDTPLWGGDSSSTYTN